MAERRYTGVEKHKNGWRGVYSVSGVRHRTRTYPTAKEAADMRAEAVTRAREGTHVDRRRSSLTVDEWFAVWHPGRRVRAITASHDEGRWRCHISPHLGGRRLDALTPHQVDRWLRWLQDNGRSLATQRKAFTLLKTALGPRGAIADRRLAVNPCDGVVPPRVDKPRWEQLDRPTFERIYAALPDEQSRALVLCAAFGGLRWSECAGLQRQDWNPLRGTLTVARGVVWSPGTGWVTSYPKSGRSRTIRVAPRLAEALNELSAGVAADGWLFTNAHGSHLSASNFRTRTWLPACKTAGATARFHDLRHSCASWLIEGGTDIGLVADMMGHQSILTTQLYIHTREQAQAEAVLRVFG
jgi:integrase